MRITWEFIRNTNSWVLPPGPAESETLKVDPVTCVLPSSQLFENHCSLRIRTNKNKAFDIQTWEDKGKEKKGRKKDGR